MKMRFAILSLIASALVAGCSQTSLEETAIPLEEMPTAGVYQSFTAKGGGEVMADGFVAAPGQEAPAIQVAAAPSAKKLCRDGLAGVWVGPLHFCRASFTVEKTKNDDSIFVVASSARVFDEPRDERDDDDDRPSRDVEQASDDSADESDNDDQPQTESDVASVTDEEEDDSFTAKYDRIEEVYGTRSYEALNEDDQADVREYYDENGGDGDWSDFEASPKF